jgi:AraC-like DNA-binding protein
LPCLGEASRLAHRRNLGKNYRAPPWAEREGCGVAIERERGGQIEVLGGGAGIQHSLARFRGTSLHSSSAACLKRSFIVRSVSRPTFPKYRSEAVEVETAAFAVGYESPSQFSREYSHLSGARSL